MMLKTGSSGIKSQSRKKPSVRTDQGIEATSVALVYSKAPGSLPAQRNFFVVEASGDSFVACWFHYEDSCCSALGCTARGLCHAGRPCHKRHRELWQSKRFAVSGWSARPRGHSVVGGDGYQVGGEPANAERSVGGGTGGGFAMFRVAPGYYPAAPPGLRSLRSTRRRDKNVY